MSSEPALKKVKSVASSQHKHSIALAFDIERTGGLATCETIAIGAAVVDEKGVQLDSFLVCLYDALAQDSFEPRCWDEFWSKHSEILATIKSKTPPIVSTAFELRRSAISKFVEFVAKWERKAEAEDFHLERCCDNTAFDVYFLNRMIENYLPGTLPFPYSMSKPQKYSQMIETHSLFKGYLLGNPCIEIDHSAVDFGFSSAFNHFANQYDFGTIHNFATSTITHDHMPHNDAFTIAWELQRLKAISRLSKTD